MSAHRQSMLETPTSHKVGRLLGFIVLLGTLAAVSWIVWQASIQVAERMLAFGWGPAFQAGDPVGMIFRCNMDLTGPCPQIFSQMWQQQLPLDMLRIVLAGGFVLGILPFLIRSHRPRKLPGQGRWATAKDLVGFLGQKGTGWYGLFEGKPLRVPAMERRTGTLIVGKPGGGKTTGYYQPNLMLDARDGWSAIVFDLKWPDEGGLMEAVNSYRYFGRPVYSYTPFVEDSARIPLLEGAENSQEASNIADIIVPRRTDGGAEFYHSLERMLLTGLVWIEGQEGRYSLQHVLAILRQGKGELKAYAEVRPQLRDHIGAVLEAREDIIAGVVAGLAGRLSLFENQYLEAASRTGAGQVPWDRFFATPSLLYIGIPQEHLEGGKATALLWLVKRIMDREIHRAAARNRGSLPTLTSLYLDEFTAFGRLPGIEDNLKTMRSKGVAYHISLQNLANGRSVYGRDAWDSIQGTFGQQVWLFERLSEDDRKTLSRTLGYQTVVGYSRSSSRSSFFSGSEGEGEREETRYLMSAEEMRETKRGEAVIFLDGKPPVRTYLGGLWEPRHPLHHLYTKIRGKAGNTPAPLAVTKAGLTGVTDVSVPSPSFEDTIESDQAVVYREPEVSLTTDAASPQPEVAPRAVSKPSSLENYIRRLASTMPAFQRYYHKKTTTGVRFVLPSGFPRPETAWVRQGWVEMRGKDEISVNLTSKGLEALDRNLAVALVRWCRVREWARPHGQEREPVVYMTEEEAETVLREFSKSLPREEGRVRVGVLLEVLGDGS